MGTLTTCNKLDGTIRHVTRLSHITIQPCVVNFVTILLQQVCVNQENLVASLIFSSSLLQVALNLGKQCEHSQLTDLLEVVRLINCVYILR